MYNLGLALCGGGSKGIAYAGVIKFLGEKNIVPDVLAGTSAGAIVATMYAAGKTPEEIIAFFKSVNYHNIIFYEFTKEAACKHLQAALFVTSQLPLKPLQTPQYPNTGAKSRSACSKLTPRRLA